MPPDPRDGGFPPRQDNTGRYGTQSRTVITAARTQARRRPRGGRRRRARTSWSSRSAPATSASTSATWPRASAWSPTSSPATQHRLPRLALGGHRHPRAAPEAGHASTRSCCSPATRRSSRPDWVPYTERLQPGDLSPGDLLPVEDDDPRLVPTYSFGDDPLDADEKAQVAPGGRRPRPRPGPHARPSRAATWPRSAGTTATPARARRSRSRRPRAARPAASCSGWPARSPGCSGSAPTATPTTTAGSSRSTTAAARTPRCS